MNPLKIIFDSFLHYKQSSQFDKKCKKNLLNGLMKGYIESMYEYLILRLKDLRPNGVKNRTILIMKGNHFKGQVKTDIHGRSETNPPFC